MYDLIRWKAKAYRYTKSLAMSFLLLIIRYKLDLSRSFVEKYLFPGGP